VHKTEVMGEYSIAKFRPGSYGMPNMSRFKFKFTAGDYLTKPEGSISRQTIVPGMAHFPGTGPKDKCCRDCKHFAGDKLTSAQCNEYLRLMGRNARTYKLDPATRSCSHFSQLRKRK
jgi:hypothetical protein